MAFLAQALTDSEKYAPSLRGRYFEEAINAWVSEECNHCANVLCRFLTLTKISLGKY